jgi:hypothetical protein
MASLLRTRSGSGLRALAWLPKGAFSDTRRMIQVAPPKHAEEIASRWPDGQHWGIRIGALMPSGGEEY